MNILETMQYQAISLFAGAGGMDVGFKAANFSVIGANELDAYACQTYQLNHPETELVEGDIDLSINRLKKFQGIDVVFGGPPCQGFSVAGKMNPSDPRSQLVFSFVDAIEMLEPKAFVMENVKALASLTKFEDTRRELIRRFQTLGFSVNIFLLNAKDFGIPQSRERVFFIGTKKSYDRITTSDIDRYKKSPLSLRDAIAHLGRSGSVTNSNVCKAKVTLAAKPVLRKSPYAGMLFNGQGRPLNPDGWSSTLPASMGGNRTPILDENHLYKNEESWVENYHAYLMKGGRPHKLDAAPSQLRRLTVDEAAVVQSFPSNYKFIGPQSKVFSQIGNAVPCQLATVVACALKNVLDGKSVTNTARKGETLELEF